MPAAGSAASHFRGRRGSYGWSRSQTGLGSPTNVSIPAMQGQQLGAHDFLH